MARLKCAINRTTPPSPGCKPDSYRLCYIRGPEGIIVMLAEQID